MKRLWKTFFFFILLAAVLPVHTLAAEFLIPVGKVVGLQLKDDCVTVAAFDEVLGSCARDAGLKIGDEILEINATPVDCAEDILNVLAQEPESITLRVRRGLKEQTLTIAPQKTEEGARLGIHLRQGIAGIGTVTFYDPEKGLFGTLGHGVSTGKGGLMNMTGGSAYEAEVLSVQRGKAGTPGQLRGSAEGLRICGSLLKNTPQGVFGITREGWTGKAIPTAEFSEVHTGAASIRSTIAGDRVQEYSVEILKIYPEDRSDGRNFLLHVTDPDLLEKTGGIVQGMSGSPIIQDGKLVGAVTHVLVNDPTRGYGIFIENMLDAA